MSFRNLPLLPLSLMTLLAAGCSSSDGAAAGDTANAVSGANPAPKPSLGDFKLDIFDEEQSTALLRIGVAGDPAKIDFSIVDTTKSGAAAHRVDGAAVLGQDRSKASYVAADDATCKLDFVRQDPAVLVTGKCAGVDYSNAYMHRAGGPSAGRAYTHAQRPINLQIGEVDALNITFVLTAGDKSVHANGGVNDAAVVGAGNAAVFNDLQGDCKLTLSMLDPRFVNGVVADYQSATIEGAPCDGVDYSGRYAIVK